MKEEMFDLINKYLLINPESCDGFDLIRISKSHLTKVISKLKNQDQLAFRFLVDIVVKQKDFVENTFEVIYFIFSLLHKKILGISVNLSFLSIDSIVQIFPVANFFECEIFEKFNINFVNNKKLKKIFEEKTSEINSGKN